MKPSNQLYSFTRNYILAFSELFSDLHVVRYDDKPDYEGNAVEWKFEKVTVVFPFTEKWFSYQRNKWLARADMNENYLFEISKTLPTISIGEFKLSYNNSAQHNKYETMLTNENKVIYTPVPYDLNTEVSIITSNLDDNFQIMEQILPYFAPTYNINVDVEQISINESVPITMTGISNTLPADLAMEDKRMVVTTLDFKMKVNYYPDKMSDINSYTTAVVIS